jgi:hypothetical protein
VPPAEAVKSSADAAAREQLAKVVEVLVADKVASFEDCIAWARLKFQVRTGRGGGVLCDVTLLVTGKIAIHAVQLAADKMSRFLSCIWLGPLL